MARPYSDDLRRKLLEAHDQPYRPGPRSRLNLEVLARLRAEHPDWTLGQLQAGLKKQAGGGLQRTVSMAAVEGDEFPAEKKTLHAQERDTEENRKRRAEFLKKIRETTPERLIYLDESGVTTSMTRLYARSRDGARIHETTPQGHWKILTILGAMSSRGMIAAMTIEEPTDADIFLAYLDHVLCLKLKPGEVVVMDNLSAHKVDGVRERITAAGAELLYLPPYSPDLNPIEKAWACRATIKNTERRQSASAGGEAAG